MNFLKSIFFSKQSSNDAFYRDFDARVNGFCIENGIRKKMEDYLLVLFKDDQKNSFRYNLIVGTGSSNSWTFEINPDWKVICKPDTYKKTIDYEIQISSKLVLVLEFPAHGNIEVAGEFRIILSRLMYQTKLKRSYSECGDRSEIDEMIKFSEEDILPVESSEETLRIFEKIKQKPNTEYAVVGQLFKFQEQEEFGVETVKPIILEAILVVSSQEKFKFVLEIVDNAAKSFSQCKIDKKLSFLFDHKNNLFLWTDFDSTRSQCFGFKVSSEDLRTLENLFLQLFTETENQVGFDQFLKNNKDDWSQFYTRQKSIGSEEELKEITKYKNDDEFLTYDFAQPLMEFSKSQFTFQEKNSFLVQAKLSNKLMITRGPKIEVYKFDEQDDSYEYKNNFSIEKSDKCNPGKIQLLENKGRLIYSDINVPDSVFVSDINKEKIVNVFTPMKGEQIKDFGIVGGKTGIDLGNETIIGLNSDALYQFDMRNSNGVVNSKSYKSKMNFDKLVTVQNDAFAVSSIDGSIRLYKDLGTNAKNVIPTYLKDRVISIDSTKDGLFLLANCGRYLMLFLTNDKESKGYEVTFRKDKKPAPRILRVHPGSISKLKLQELSFVNAKFDEHRFGHEKFIIAWNEKAYAIWSLTKIMRNDFSTEIVRRMDEKVVSADFRYNADDIIAAFPGKIAYQKTKMIKS